MPLFAQWSRGSQLVQRISQCAREGAEERLGHLHEVSLFRVSVQLFLYCLKVRSCLADVICSQNVCDIFENENFFLQIFNLQIIKNHVLVENLVDFSQFALPRSSPHLNGKRI